MSSVRSLIENGIHVYRATVASVYILKREIFVFFTILWMVISGLSFHPDGLRTCGALSSAVYPGVLRCRAPPSIPYPIYLSEEAGLVWPTDLNSTVLPTSHSSSRSWWIRRRRTSFPRLLVRLQSSLQAGCAGLILTLARE